MTNKTDSQMFLFSDEPIRCYKNFAGVDEKFLKLLKRFELLSFDYEARGVTEEQLIEVIFPKTVIKSGFPFEKVIEMLDLLPKPYAYKFTDIFWDISMNKWRHFDEIRQLPEKNVEIQDENFFPPEEDIIQTLKDLNSLGDKEALTKIKGILDSLLAEE